MLGTAARCVECGVNVCAWLMEWRCFIRLISNAVTPVTAPVNNRRSLIALSQLPVIESCREALALRELLRGTSAVGSLERWHRLSAPLVNQGVAKCAPSRQEYEQMIKTLCCLGSATLGVMLLSACGSTASLNVDKSILSRGENNQVSTGGYLWTYTDHNDATSIYHATIDQLTSQEIALQPKTDDDPNHGKVLRVAGAVPVELPWTDVAGQTDFTIDTHWRGLYPDSRVPAYPAAGLGFGFLDHNAKYDATQKGKYVGIAFDMKLNADAMPSVFNSFPMVGTDLPDEGFKDEFPAPGQPGGCEYYTDSNTPASGYQTCFANYRKVYVLTGGTDYTSLAATGSWHRYCTLFSEVGVPSWANTLTKDHVPGFDPTNILKMQWDMFQPKTGGVTTNYDISLDNIQLITAEQAADSANNCDPNMIDAAYGSGNEG